MQVLYQNANDRVNRSDDFGPRTADTFWQIYGSGEKKLRIPVVFNCLIVCCLFSISVFARQNSPLVPALEQNVELQPARTDSPDLNDSETTSEVPDVTAPDPQAGDNGQGSPSGNGSGTGSGSSGGNSSGSQSGSGTGNGTGALASTTYVFPTSGEMNRYWLKNTLGPKALIGATFSATWGTWVTDSPSGWGKDASGWGQRYGTSLLDNGINTSTLILWSRAMNQDPRFSRCDCTGVKARGLHAIKLSFMSRDRSGRFVFSPAKIGSPFAGPMVTRNTIYPETGWGRAFSGGAYYLAGSVAWNLAREFIFRRGLLW